MEISLNRYLRHECESLEAGNYNWLSGMRGQRVFGLHRRHELKLLQQFVYSSFLAYR